MKTLLFFFVCVCDLLNISPSNLRDLLTDPARGMPIPSEAQLKYLNAACLWICWSGDVEPQAESLKQSKEHP